MLGCPLGAGLQAASVRWSEPLEVRQDSTLCVTYRARLSGPYLVIEAKHEPGWHSNALDNKQRVEEKLNGKKALGVDQPTAFTLSGGLQLAGPWLQTPPKDFSKPEYRIYTFGFIGQVVFAVKVKRTGNGAAVIGIRGQACTESSCKNIDEELSLPVTGKETDPADIDLKALIQSR